MMMPEYELIRSERKTLRIEVKAGRLLVRAPLRMSLKRIEQCLEDNREWIENKIRASAERTNEQPFLSEDEILSLARAAAKELVPLAFEFASQIGKEIFSVTIRTQRTRWGSCSSKGSLSFNALIMLAPPEIRRSVAAHEVCHLAHMDHSASFYETLSKLCPDHKECRKWLRQNGEAILARLPDDVSVTCHAYPVPES